MEKNIKMVEKIDLTKAIILDACATTLVEEICDEVEESIRSNIENGKFITYDELKKFNYIQVLICVKI